MKSHLPVTLFFIAAVSLSAQNTARITGNLQSNGNFFIRDSAIGASNTPQYDSLLFGAESWLTLNYSNWGFDVGVRFDMFNNSNLLNPTSSYTAEGIGRWYVAKSIDKVDLAGGYLYDQIGSGILFRAYEERSLMIDNALYGVRVGYRFNENWKIKAFTGRMKQQFSRYGAIIRGGALEGFIKPDSTGSFSLAPGIGVVARTHNGLTINNIRNALVPYLPEDRFKPQFNTYGASLYNTLTAGPVTWFIEGAYKTKDVMYDPFATVSGSSVPGKLINSGGYTVYSSLAYAKSGLGVTVEAKQTKNFSFRTDPFQTGIQGAMNFLPPMARQNTYRLTARFVPATQELGERAVQLDARYAFSKKLSIGLNASEIQLLGGTELYREITPEFTYKYKRKWQLIGGLQLVRYNIFVYQAKTDPIDSEDPLDFLGGGKKDYVDALTPYAEWLYKFTPRRSMRLEAQYLVTDDEFGSWVNALAEFGWAPHWLVYVSDMYKLEHGSDEPASKEKTKYDGLHYPSAGIVYTQRANRFELAFVKQVEGINCAGGICRYEPTFSGVRLRINSSF